MSRVLVTDAGRGSGIATIRSLGRNGIEVVAADTSSRSPAFVSRYVQQKVVYPSPDTEPDAAIEALVSATRDHQVDLVVPVGETLVTLLTSARDRFPASTVLALAEAEALDLARDKRATVELAERLGIPTPRTVVVESVAEAGRAARELGWPVVLKPHVSRTIRDSGYMERFGVGYAADSEELAMRMGELEGRCAVLLQEYCGGEGHGVGLLMDRGHALLGFQHRRLREVPTTGGPSSFRESVPLDPRLLDDSVRLLRELRWTGPAMVEFKVGPAGAKLMEVNGRLWGSLALAVKSGVDLPSGIVDLYLSPDARPSQAPIPGYRVGVRSRDLTLEVSWIASVLRGAKPYGYLGMPRRRDALATAVRLFDPRDGYDILGRDDPLPGLVELAGLGLSIPARALRSVRHRGRR